MMLKYPGMRVNSGTPYQASENQCTSDCLADVSCLSVDWDALMTDCYIHIDILDPQTDAGFHFFQKICPEDFGKAQVR